MHAVPHKPTWEDVIRQRTPSNPANYDRKEGRTTDRHAHWDQNRLRANIAGQTLQHELAHAAITFADVNVRHISTTSFFGELLVRLADLLTDRKAIDLSEVLSRVRQNQQALIDSHLALHELARLEPDWDSYGAAPPTPQAIASGYGVVLNVWKELAETATSGIGPWTTAPLHNGGIQFEWKGPVGIVEIEVSPSGKLSYLVEQDDETVRESDPEVDAGIQEVVRAVREAIGH